MKPEIGALLNGYATGTLTPEEEKRLLDASLEDQEVFDALALEHPLRELLRDPACRSELLEELRRRGWAAQARAWLRAGWFLTGLATSTAALIVTWLLLSKAPSRQGPPGPLEQPSGFQTPLVVTRPSQGSEHAEALRQLAALPVTGTPGASLELDRAGDLPTYAVGDAMRLSLQVPSEANALVLEQRSDGSLAQLFPTADSPFPRLKANRRYTVPDNDGPPLTVTGPTGRRTMRLLLFSPGTGVGALTPRQVAALRSDVQVILKTLEVVP